MVRIGTSKRAFTANDHHLWRRVYKSARYSHPNKPVRWVITRYFGEFNPSRQDTWVFGSQDTGYYLRKFALDTDRPAPGGGRDGVARRPNLAAYWVERRRRSKPPLGNTTLRLLREQH